MPAYTNATNVGKVITVEAGYDVTGAIDTAHGLVAAVCENSGYSTELKELIERWLAAHFYDVNRPRTQSSAAGSLGLQRNYEPLKVDLGLNVTKFGQQALALDYKGNLRALAADKGVRAGSFYVGGGCR